MAAELAGILKEVERGARLLYDGLPVHSLGEGQLCTAVTAHLDRPCIAYAGCLLRDLASAAALDVAALRRSSPDLARTLERRAAEVQAAVEASRAYWLEMAELLAAQRQVRPARLRVVHMPNPYHSTFPLSGGLSACARRWAQFRVWLAAWGMESRKKSLAIKKFHPAVITAKLKKNRFCYSWHAEPISSRKCLER